MHKREWKVCGREQMLLYAVTDSRYATEKYTLEEQIEDALKGGVTLVQLREKSMNTEQLANLGIRVRKICDRYRVPMLIDDNVEAALLCRADGVHVGQNDITPQEVRKIMGNDVIVGVTAKTVEQAKRAQENGASYIGTGAAFPTGTKKDTYVISHDVIKEICESISIPVVAIGGINYDNADMLKGTGIDGIAVVSAIFGEADIKQAAYRLKEKAYKII